VWERFVVSISPSSDRESLSVVRTEFWGDTGKIVLFPFGRGLMPSAVLELYSKEYEQFARSHIHSSQDIEDVTDLIDEFEHQMWIKLIKSAREFNLPLKLGRDTVTVTRCMPQDDEIYESVILG
jgi:hypothetical protein